MSFLKNLCSIESYKKIVEENIEIFKNIERICKKTGEKIEGNCFTKHQNMEKKSKLLLYKQCNHFSLGKISNSIMEIGFNAGHSSLLYLLSNPSCNIVVFDLCSHKYTMLCFEYLKTIFPNRLEIYPGDSTVTVPQYYINNPNKRFDLIHIDGCHAADIANKDFYNSLKLANDIIIWDDTQLKKIDNLFKDYIKKGLVYEVSLYKTFIYEHKICRVNKILNKKYKFNNNNIIFSADNKVKNIKNSSYEFVSKYVIRLRCNNEDFWLKFDSNYSNYKIYNKHDIFF